MQQLANKLISQLSTPTETVNSLDWQDVSKRWIANSDNWNSVCYQRSIVDRRVATCRFESWHKDLARPKSVALTINTVNTTAVSVFPSNLTM